MWEKDEPREAQEVVISRVGQKIEKQLLHILVQLLSSIFVIWDVLEDY